VFNGSPVITTEFPADVRKALSGVRSGDVRLNVSPQNLVYVLVVQQVTPSAPQPYEEVRESIARKVMGRKMEAAVEAYAAKLRSLSDVKVYLTAS
jgi:hypothetical protein